jgi:hypothetical protein
LLWWLSSFNLFCKKPGKKNFRPMTIKISASS